MDSKLIFRNDDGTTNTWHCRELGLERLTIDEYNSLLGEAYLFWSDFIHPAVAFDFEERRRNAKTAAKKPMTNPALAPIFRVDCSSRNPFDFVIDMPTTNLEPVAVRDLGPEYVRRIVALDINYARGQRKALYQHIKQEFDGVARACYRLLLPMLGSARDVTEIFGFCRPESVAQPLAPLASRGKSRRNKDSVDKS
jgi:hypothetical protein